MNYDDLENKVSVTKAGLSEICIYESNLISFFLFNSIPMLLLLMNTYGYV